MKLKGNGYCKSGYYAGWDGQGTANQEACNMLCLSEKQCTFAAYLNDGQKQTCSRYKGKSCILDTSSEHKRAHTTYYKYLPQGIFYFFVMIMHIDYHKFRIAKLRTLNFGEKFSILDNVAKKI